MNAATKTTTAATNRLTAACAFALGVALSGALALLAAAAPVHADPQAALDRQLTERMTRALEAQARATERLVQATERAGERCHGR